MGLALRGGERRRDPRLPLKLAAHCQVGTDYSRGDLLDLSSTGLGLATSQPWPQGTAVRLALALPYTEGPKFCSLSGTVVRIQAGQVGMKLDPAPARIDRELLQGFLSLLAVRRQAML